MFHIGSEIAISTAFSISPPFLKQKKVVEIVISDSMGNIFSQFAISTTFLEFPVLTKSLMQLLLFRRLSKVVAISFAQRPFTVKMHRTCKTCKIRTFDLYI